MQTLWLCGELEILFYAPVAIVSTYLSKHRCNLQWRIYKDDAYAWEMVTRIFSHMNWFNSKSDEHILSVRCPRFHINQTKRKRLCWTYGHHSKIICIYFIVFCPYCPCTNTSVFNTIEAGWYLLRKLCDQHVQLFQIFSPLSVQHSTWHGTICLQTIIIISLLKFNFIWN